MPLRRSRIAITAVLPTIPNGPKVETLTSDLVPIRLGQEPTPSQRPQCKITGQIKDRVHWQLLDYRVASAPDAMAPLR
jgi:hypothetical protein